MNSPWFRISTLVTAVVGVGLLVGCSPDVPEGFDDSTRFFCEDDDDCEGVNMVCDTAAERCVVDEPEDAGDVDAEPQECNPDELGDDYPLDDPLDAQEVCDGRDNNCDGHVDVIFCEDDGDCPSSGEDVYGTSLTYECEENDEGVSVCKAYHSDRFLCPDPFPCDSEAGAHESVYEECGEGEPPPNDDPDECDPEELGDDYPLDEPLEIQEVCDGEDNNCDGHVDVIFCDNNDDCPSSGEDVYGTELEYECEENGDGESVCQAYYEDRNACPDALPCDSDEGAHESVFEACGEGEEPPEDDEDDDNGDNGDGG